MLAAHAGAICRHLGTTVIFKSQPNDVSARFELEEYVHSSGKNGSPEIQHQIIQQKTREKDMAIMSHIHKKCKLLV